MLKTERELLVAESPFKMSGQTQMQEKPNPNNPIVFFDITVGNTVSFVFDRPFPSAYIEICLRSFRVVLSEMRVLKDVNHPALSDNM